MHPRVAGRLPRRVGSHCTTMSGTSEATFCNTRKRAVTTWRCRGATCRSGASLCANFKLKRADRRTTPMECLPSGGSYRWARLTQVLPMRRLPRPFPDPPGATRGPYSCCTACQHTVTRAECMRQLQVRTRCRRVLEKTRECLFGGSHASCQTGTFKTCTFSGACSAAAASACLHGMLCCEVR